MRNEDNSIVGYTGINIIFETGFKEELLKSNIENKFIEVYKNYGVIYIKNFEDIKKIINFKTIVRMEYETFLTPLGSVSSNIKGGVVAIEEIGASYFHNNPNVSITGSGVIIGIVDTGIDYLHPDFIYGDETSKILYIWDQTKDGNPPEEHYIGTEYTNNQINEAIKIKDKNLCKDENGHGTMVSGIAAGMGKLNPEYIGVAPDAELIVVKVKKIDNMYTNTMTFAANEYIVNKCMKLGKPLVLLTSFGSNFLSGIVDRRISPATYFTRGLSVVTSAGNEGDTQTHSSGKLNSIGEVKDIILEVGSIEKNLQLQFWVSRPDKINIAIVAPSGEISKEIPVSDYTEASGVFDLEGTEYIIQYNYPTTFSGQQFTRIRLINAKPGIWLIRLKGENIISGIYHIYLPNRSLINISTKFRESDPFYTINYPATYKDTIGVGGYDTINKSLWKGSSRGDTIQDYQAPDLIAPSVNIIAPYPNQSYGTITGTSAGAAYVAGAIALYFQYVHSDENYKAKGYTQMARTYLEAGAKTTKNINYPNESFGYGVLDIRGMFNQFK